MKTINIIDSGCERYTIKPDCYCLGRMWDHLAEQINVIKPERETGNTCTMIVSSAGVVIDNIDIGDTPYNITNVLTRHPSVEISFTFTNESGYVKNSEIQNFYFAEGRKPEDFVPVEPEQTGKLNLLVAKGFIRAEIDGDILKFYNTNDESVQELILPAGSGGGGGSSTIDYNRAINKPSINGVTLEGNKTTEELGIVSEENDPTVPSYVKEISEEDIESWNNKQGTTDETLETDEKSIVGAINELNALFVDTGRQLDEILGV